MSQKRILYITQEIVPYLPETPIANISRYLPQAIQEKGHEIRTFMPKYGAINERRNQLHEVIRLSGMNLIIDDTDHSLIIKVASIQAARMQVYFIDNDDYFQNREMFAEESGVEYDDNDERSIFFIRGVMETIKKLRWVPDIIHCHGWFSALAPIYIKKGYKDDPCLKNAKVIYSVYDDTFEKPFQNGFAEKLRFDTIGDEEIESVANRGKLDYAGLTRMAVDYSDGVIIGSEKIDPEVQEYINQAGVKQLAYEADFDKNVDKIKEFYSLVDA